MAITRREFVALGAAGVGCMAAGIGGYPAMAGASWAGAAGHETGGLVPLKYFQWVPLTPDPPRSGGDPRGDVQPRQRPDRGRR
jgi:hypothetical protein